MITYSFIIPHHNSPELVQRLVDSIPQRKDIEIIIADDNSDSGKKAVVVRPDVKIIYIDKNHSRWAGHARNVAMEEACGKWLLFADADDFYNNGFIDELDKYKDSDLDILYFNADSVNSETLEKSHRTTALNKFIDNYIRTGEGLDLIKYRFRTPWFKMYNHAFVKKYGIRFEEVIKGNDMFFSFKTSYLAKKVLVIPDVLYVCTYSPISMTFQKRSIESHLFTLRNIICTNMFYAAIGHKDWHQNLMRNIWLVCKNEGVVKMLRVLCAFVKNFSSLYVQRNYYVNRILKK